MIQIEKIQVFNLDGALRGMRNPMNSWDKSDSYWSKGFDDEWEYKIGKNDLDLMRRLYKAGPEHRKYMRQIFISMDITAPLYWWKEFDTYKVGTTSNSCSTMHKLAAKEFTEDDFSISHITAYSSEDCPSEAYNVFMRIISRLNILRKLYLETKDTKWWYQMVELLPSSYNQRRTITMTLENFCNMYFQRKDHKLLEWKKFCSILYDELPLFQAIIKEDKL